jgi:hypothetical protein
MAQVALDRTKTTEVPTTDGLQTSRPSARRTVKYRDVNGKTHDAVVVAPGSSSGLKLAIWGQGSGVGEQRRVIDNVALMTSRTQTNVYWNSRAV